MLLYLVLQCKQIFEKQTTQNKLIRFVLNHGSRVQISHEHFKLVTSTL